MRRLLLLAFAGSLFAVPVPVPASGGVGPTPFKLVISKRSDVIDAGSPLRGQALTDIVLHLEVQGGVSDSGAPLTRIVEVPLAGAVGRPMVSPLDRRSPSASTPAPLPVPAAPS